MAFSQTPEEYQQRLLDTLLNDSAIVGRRIAFWQNDIDMNDYTDAQRNLKLNELADEKRLQNVIDALAASVGAVEV
jgi:hypothetical protein